MDSLITIKRKNSDGSEYHALDMISYMFNMEGNIYMNDTFIHTFVDDFTEKVFKLEKFPLKNILKSNIEIYENMLSANKDLYDFYEYKYCVFNEDSITLNMKRVESEDPFDSEAEIYLDYAGAIVVIKLNNDLFEVPEFQNDLKCIDRDIKIYENNKTTRAVKLTFNDQEYFFREFDWGKI